MRRVLGSTRTVHDITAEARPLIDAENTRNAANHTADGAANDSPDRPTHSFTLASPAFDATRNALSRRNRWKERASGNHGQCNDRSFHVLNSL